MAYFIGVTSYGALGHVVSGHNPPVVTP